MRLLAACLLIIPLVASTRAPQTPRLEMEVHETVVHFLELLGGLRFYALGQYMTEDANVITARWSRSGFVNRVQSGREWLDGLMEGPSWRAPRPSTVHGGADQRRDRGRERRARPGESGVRDRARHRSGVVRCGFFYAGPPERPVETRVDRVHVDSGQRTKPRRLGQERLDAGVPAHRARIRVAVFAHAPRQVFVRRPLIELLSDLKRLRK